MTKHLAASLALALAVALAASLGACRARETAAPVFGESIRVNDVDGGAGQSEPSIAADAEGRTLLATWIDWSESVPFVRLARSTNGGASFAASRRIDANPLHTHGQAEGTLAWNAGRFALGWIGCRPDADSLEDHACDVYATTSSDGGVSWARPIAIAEGGSPRRDRPWVIADGERFGIAWTEVDAKGSTWRYARERAGGGAFETQWSLEGRGALQPPVATAAGLEVLLVDRGTRDARTTTLERRRMAGGEPSDSSRWTVPREAALLPYSVGAFACRADGESWVALPEGDGERDDLTLLHRAPGASFREARGLRSSDAVRIGLPWIIPLREPGRFLASWIEEGHDGWRVRARILGPQASASRAADLSPAGFAFAEASRNRNIGDFLAATTAGDAFWVAWSDTRDGDADVWIARGKIP